MPLFLNAEPASTGTIFSAKRGFANGLAHFLDGKRAFGQILVENGVVVFGDVFDGLVAVLVVEGLVDRGTLQRRGDIRAAGDECRIPQLGNFENFKLGAERFFEPHDDFFFDEIDDADEIVFAAEGKLQRHGMRAKALANGADDVIKIRAHAVHFVDKADARHAVLVRLAPHGFRLRLHAGNGVKHADGAVEHAQGTLDFHGEIHVARAYQ